MSETNNCICSDQFTVVSFYLIDQNAMAMLSSGVKVKVH